MKQTEEQLDVVCTDLAVAAAPKTERLKGSFLRDKPLKFLGIGVIVVAGRPRLGVAKFIIIRSASTWFRALPSPADGD